MNHAAEHHQTLLASHSCTLYGKASKHQNVLPPSIIFFMKKAVELHATFYLLGQITNAQKGFNQINPCFAHMESHTSPKPKGLKQ